LAKRLKWKPPSENSVDFKLVLRFPPLPHDLTKPDFHAKPLFLLHVWTGGDRYEQFDEMYVEDEEWERFVFLFPSLSSFQFSILAWAWNLSWS